MNSDVSQISSWYQLSDPAEVITPALLVYPDRVARNIDRMIEIAGNVARLRPHVKTHKSAEIIRLQLERGITKFKCATIPEARLLANCGAKDILLAMQPVGPHVHRLIELIREFPDSQISTIADNARSIAELSEAAVASAQQLGVFLDLDTGMHRTGIIPGETALELYKLIAQSPGLKAKGLHAYDGHLRAEDPETRRADCDRAFAGVRSLKDAIEKSGFSVDIIVAGGSPSFPIHARREGVELSPGTTLLWDERYGSSFAEMEFSVAAVLLTRVISLPGDDLVCLDLGHKSVAPEMGFPRVKLLGLEAAEQVGQSEEHLVVRVPDRQDIQVGDLYYAIPLHICPTVAKYPELITVADGAVSGRWGVDARDH